MAGGDELLSTSNGAKGALAAVLLIGSATNVYDAFSAVMSSPWSTQKFTEDDEAEKMANEYVMHGCVISGAYSIAGALLARNAWPLLGAAGVMIYMVWLYRRALRMAKEKRTSLADQGFRR